MHVRSVRCPRSPLTSILSMFAMAVALLWSASAFAHHGNPPKHFVLVHGGWQGAWSWHQVEAVLESSGHTVTALDLPSLGIDGAVPGTVSLQDYTDRVVATLDAAPDPVVLVAHSMGGIVISSAAEARPDKVDKLVYVAAFLIPNGGTLLDVALADSEALITPNLIVDFSNGTVDVNRALLGDIFFNRSPASAEALGQALFKKTPLAPLATPLQLTEAGFGSVPRFYVETRKDHAISLSVQRAMVAQLPVEKVYSINTDHSPFLSKPHTLSRYLLDAAYH